MKRLTLLTALVLGASGCSLWFALEGDPGDLPCADEAPVCLDGYTCIEEQNGDRLCRLAAAIPEGGTCNADAECEDGLVCVDAYDAATCPEEIRDLDPNCRAGFTGVNTCRRVCDPFGNFSECPSGQRCFTDNLGNGFCQEGVCTDDSDCGNNEQAGLQNVCFLVFNGGGSGLCLNRCRPFECESPNATCNDCPALDINGDNIPETWGCVPIRTDTVPPQLVPERYGCAPVGEIPAGQACAGDFDCAPDGFCTSVITGAAGTCGQYCAIGGGAPACNVGTCTGQLEAEIGFCQ